MRDTLPHLVKQSMHGRIISACQRRLKAQRVSRSMALENQAAQAKQGRAVVAPMINTIFKCI